LGDGNWGKPKACNLLLAGAIEVNAFAKGAFGESLSCRTSTLSIESRD